MPCSQMISMNCRPPRPIEIMKLATLPATKARMRNNERLNIGSATRRSIMTNTTSSASPPMSSASTIGLVHPIEWPP